MTKQSQVRQFRSGKALRATLAFLLFAVTIIAALMGCGGSGGSSPTDGTGRATLKITWPEPTRLIPIASKSITVSFLNGNTVIASKTVDRPAVGNESTVTFDGLPAINLTLKAEAFPNIGGTGVAQASATQGVTVVKDQTIDVGITMNSTIVSFSITPLAPGVKVGDTVQLNAAAKDSLGRTVLVTAATRTFTSSDTSIATVDNTGLVTGVANGKAKITVADSESGVSAFVTVTVSNAGSSTIVDLATVYLDSLSTAQRAASVVSSSAENAAKWSDLMATPASDGTNSLRNGVAYSTLTSAQKNAWENLVQAALGDKGYNRLGLIRNSDEYLGGLASGYDGDYVYVGFVGEPTDSSEWVLQVGGHHIANNYYFQGSTALSTTPYFLGVEPQSFVLNSTTYTPMVDQRNGMFNLIKSLTTTQLASAKLSTTFTDVLLGPGKDARSNFPTSGRGLIGSDLTSAQKTLLKAAIAAWTQDSANASEYQTLYESELNDTYVAYSGTTTFTNAGDYVRIDGPHVWIEFLCLNGEVLTSQIHFHSVWRDRVSDYDAKFGF